MSKDYTDFYHTGPGTLAGRYLRRFWQPVSRAEGFVPTDILFKKSSRNHKVNLPEEFGKDPILLYAPTWNDQLNSVDVLGNDWIDNLTKSIPNLNLIIKPHPGIVDFNPQWIESWRHAAQQNS